MVEVAEIQGVDDTINVTVADANCNPASTTVAVSDRMNCTKGTKATSHVIVVGKCLTACGNTDAGGRLQATFVSVGTASGTIVLPKAGPGDPRPQRRKNGPGTLLVSSARIVNYRNC